PAAPLPGTQDLLLESARRLRRCEAALCDVFEKGGYGEVIPPAIEGADVFGPEAFRALDRSGRLIALRADFTAQVARIAATRLAAALNVAVDRKDLPTLRTLCEREVPPGKARDAILMLAEPPRPQTEARALLQKAESLAPTEEARTALQRVSAALSAARSLG